MYDTVQIMILTKVNGEIRVTLILTLRLVLLLFLLLLQKYLSKIMIYKYD